MHSYMVKQNWPEWPEYFPSITVKVQLSDLAENVYLGQNSDFEP